MEACMVKPEVKKKPRPPKPPPKPPEIKKPDSSMVEKPTPVVPQRPKDAELTHTQYRMKRSSKEVKENLEQETIEKRKKTETPAVPPRPTEKELNAPKRYSYHKREKPEDTRTSRETDQSVKAEAPKDEADFKQANPSALTGMFWKSQKEKPPSFTSYLIDSNEEEKRDDTPAKQAPANKQGVLKGVMKGLQFKSSPKTSREPSPDPSSVEPASEKEESMEKNKQQKNAESKQDKGGLLTGMFKKTHKEKTSSPVLTVTKADSDSEDTDDQTSEGSLTDLSARRKLSGSSDSLSANTKEKTGLFSGMFKKPPKTAEAAPTDEDQQSLHGDLSNSADNLCENSKDKGGFFSGILRKSPKPPGEETPGQEKQQIESSGRDENLSDNISREKGGVFGGRFKKSPKPSEGSQLEEGEESLQGELSISTDNLLEKKEKGGLFSGLLKKTPKTPGEDNMPEKSSLSASNDSLSEAGNTKDRGGVFTGMFKKLSKLTDDPPTAEEKQVTEDELSTGSDSPSEDKAKEKGGIFGGIFKKPPKPAEAAQTEEDDLNKELSTSSENLSESKQEKGAIFGVRLKKTPKTSGEKTESPDIETQNELSSSNEDLSESNTTKEKNIFSNIFKKPHKSPEDTAVDKELEDNKESQLSGSNENIVEATAPKEKKGGLAAIFKRSASIENVLDSEDKNIFSGMFKKTSKSSEGKPAEEDSNTGEDKVFMSSSENLSDTPTSKEKTGGLAGIFKKFPKPAEAAETEEEDFDKELSTSRENLSENKQEKNIFSNLFKKPHKSAGDAALDKELEENNESELSRSNENIVEATAPKEKKSGLAGIFKRSASTENLLDSEDKNIFSGMFKKTNKPSEGKPADEDSNASENKTSSSCENLSVTTSKEKTGGLAGIFRRSPKPAPRSVTSKDPLSDTKELYGSCDSIPDIGKEDLSGGEELSASNENLSETTKEKKTGFSGMFRRTPKTVEKQDSEDMEPLEGGGLRRRRTIKKKRRVVSFRVKKTLPRIPKLNLTSQNAEEMPKIEESVELQELIPEQESTVELQNVEMAAYPTEGNPLDSEEENDGLLDWWKTVEGWAEWNESSNFQEQDEETAMEQAADRIYMAARLFVRLFNQHGASLQQRILELLALADAADQFHKKTVQAAVGGGVASVCGSVATITGLILAPFTFGASIIVTAVGIGVATAGSITSATANITDTVHSNMDRKKVEKMIQGYQEEINDIRECLEFVQEGMDTLQELDFDKYSQSAAKKALNHNIKHVMKEGGRAGKALMINTDKLISTVQVLGAAGGAAKAAQAISVTTGVMSALFLALDVFFLAKDSHELRKGAKTKFATKIREVCKDLQDGLLELNKVKTQLQKTMDGIELEEYEEIEEVEVEVDDDLESDPVKLAELEQELDMMEEKLDRKIEEEKKRIEEEKKKAEEERVEEEKKAEEERKRVEEEKEAAEEKRRVEEEEKKNEEAEKANKKDTEKSVKEKGESKEKTEKEGEAGGNDVKKEEENDSQKEESEKEAESKLERLSDEEKQQNILTSKAAKGKVLKGQSHKGTKKDKELENQITAGKEKYEQGSVPKKKTDDKKEEGNKTGKEQLESKSHSGVSKGAEWTKTVSSEKVKSERETTKSSRGDERGTRGKYEVKPEKKEAEMGSKRTDSSRSDSDRSPRWSKHGPRAEEEREVKDWRAEMSRSKEEKREREPKSETERSKESHRSHETPVRREQSDRDSRSSREEADAKRSHSRRGHEERGSRVKDEEERGKRREESDTKRSHSRRGHEERGSRVKDEEEEEERRKRREESDAKRSHSRRGHEERGSRVKDEEEEERGKRREDGESRGSRRERRESDRDRGHGHSRRGSRPRSNALLDDGLYI